MGNNTITSLSSIEMSVKELVARRALTHGSWAETARVAQNIKNAMGSSPNWPNLADSQKEGLDMIAQKIARILTGNMNADEHWEDIAGYIELIRRGL
jgi:hypothetical protein